MAYPVVGVVGGGQLARMLAQAAVSLGVRIRVLAASPRDCAALVVSESEFGAPDDLEAIRRFASGVDVLTFDHEQVPQSILETLESDGVVLQPGRLALRFSQDKLLLRELLETAGLPNPRWRRLDGLAAAGEEPAALSRMLADFGGELGWPLVLKLSRGGYDGRGVWVVSDLTAAVEVVESVRLAPGQKWLVEEAVEFDRELAVQVARSANGEVVGYPVVESVQRDGMCREVYAPAPDLSDSVAVAARELAGRIAELTGVVGMLAVELFATAAGRLLVNELAMRPHNCGHWTMDAALTSQFENHLRAVLGLPLGSPRLRTTATAMVNVVGGEVGGSPDDWRAALGADSEAKVHLYGKAFQPGRKLGHVNLCGDDIVEVAARARQVADRIAGAGA